MKKSEKNFLKTGLLDDLLGGVPIPSVTLIEGYPGVGKSTLVIQIAERVHEITSKNVLFITSSPREGPFRLLKHTVVKTTTDIQDPESALELFRVPELKDCDPVLIIMDDLWCLAGNGRPSMVAAAAATWALFARLPVLITACSPKDEAKPSTQLEEVRALADARVTIAMAAADTKDWKNHVRTLYAGACRWHRKPGSIKLRMTEHGFVPN